MGKYTLLIVLGAIVGGSMLTLNQRRSAHLTGQTRAEGQSSLLARQIAESGQGVALTTAIRDDGFMSDAAFFAAFGTDPKAYNGGFYQADSFRSYDSGRRADLVVSGYHGSGESTTRHVVTSSYEFDPMDYPGPIWLDVPYATASGGGSTTIDGTLNRGGTSISLAAHVDQTKYNEMGGLLSLATMRSQLEAAISGTAVQFSNGLKNTTKNALLGSGKLLDDLNVDNAEDLYQTVIGAMTASDRTLTPPTPGGVHMVATSVSWDGPTTITHVNGSLTITTGGRVDGEGVLAVSGNLLVQNGGRLDWDGLVIVRSDEDAMAVEFLGQTRIDGALVVNQEAAPQVGHMDITVLKSPDGSWSPAWGETGPTWGPGRPWYQHTHKFDELPGAMPSESERVARFVHNGDVLLNQDANLIFQQTLDALGSDDVQIRFKNVDRHGHGFYSLQLDGEPLVEGPVRAGFSEDFAQGNSFTTRAFPANELESFTLDIRSLPMLKRLFGTEPGCDVVDWPVCVGLDRNREGALTVQLVHNAKVIYEAALYWHVRTDEWADHLAKLAAWQAEVLASGSFGTNLNLTRADITFDLPSIVRLSDRLNFDGNRVNLLSTAVRHISAEEYRTQQETPTSTSPGTSPTLICHKSGGPNVEITVAGAALSAHLLHGDTVGPC